MQFWQLWQLWQICPQSRKIVNDFSHFKLSSRVNEVIKTISSQFIYLFFLRKDFERTKSIKAQNKQFSFIKSFFAQKIVAFVFFFVHLFLFFLVGFSLIYVFVRSKSFLKKNKLAWDCLDSFIYSKSLWKISKCMNLII